MSFDRNKSKHILIIGGMGPQASVYAHELVIKRAAEMGAADNEGYPRVTHLSINVKDFISQPTYRDEARDYILECLRDINLSTVDAAFIACNTAHILADDIVAATNLPLTSLMDVTKDYFAVKPGVTKIGILATPSTLQTGLYQKTLGDMLSVIVPDNAASRKVEDVIRQVIAGKPEEELAAELQTEIDHLKAQGAEYIILGCTELSLLGSYLTDTDIVDPLILTVQKVIS